MSEKQLQKFRTQKEEKYQEYRLAEIEKQHFRHVTANYYMFYVSLLLRFSYTSFDSAYSVVIEDYQRYFEALFTSCDSSERKVLLHRCHLAFRHYLVN